jgi:hypothetical protein
LTDIFFGPLCGYGVGGHRCDCESIQYEVLYQFR